MGVNLLTYYRRGDDSMAEDLLINLQESLSSLALVREVMPLWTDWGISDEGLWVHSLGCTFWTILGYRLGRSAVSDVPAPSRGQFAKIYGQVRSDSIWFNNATHQPEVLVEFERYNGKQDTDKLMSKMKNLLLAHHRWSETAKLLILAYWTKGLTSLPQHSELTQLVQEGFETSIKETVSGSKKGTLLFFQFVMQEEKDGLLRLSAIIPRGLS